MGTKMGSIAGIVVGRGMEVWVGSKIGGCVGGTDVGIGCDRGGICKVDGIYCDVVGRGSEIGVDF